MKAMVLAAGRGSRMRSMTDDQPKPLVQVAGKAMMLYAVENLKRTGVQELVINTHYLANAIKSFVHKQNKFGVTVHFSDEESLLDTGGGILKARKYLEGSDCFIVHNADVYSEIDLAAMLTAHQSSGAAATLAIKKRDTSRGLLFTEDMSLIGWENKNTEEIRIAEEVDLAQSYSSYGFCGIHILSPQIFDSFDAMGETRFSVINAYLSAVAAGIVIKGYDVGASTWFDIGTPEKLASVEQYLASKS